MNRSSLFFVLHGLICSAAWSQSPESRALNASLVDDLRRTTGDAYLDARQRLLGSDRTAAIGLVESAIRLASDPLEHMCLESVKARVRDPDRMDKSLSEAFDVSMKAFVGENRNWAVKEQGPSPMQGAIALVKRLGDDALPLAAETLSKGVAQAWEPWRREMLVSTASLFGSPTIMVGREAHALQVRDPRAAQLLLWVLDHEREDSVAARAAVALRRFPLPETVSQLRSRLGRFSDGPRRAAVTGVLQELERVGTASRPATGAALPGAQIKVDLPFRFDIDARRVLSQVEAREAKSLLETAVDSGESAVSRVFAVRLLGLYVAHQTCIQPLSALAREPSEPEEVRRAAVVALSQIPDEVSVAELVRVMEERPDSEEADAAGQGLSLLTNEACSPFLSGKAMNAEEYHRERVRVWKDWWQKHKDQDMRLNRTQAVLNLY